MCVLTLLLLLPLPSPPFSLERLHIWGYNFKAAICKIGRISSPEQDHADNLASDFSTLELQKHNRFLSPSLWDFIMAAREDTYRSELTAHSRNSGIEVGTHCQVYKVVV